MDLENRPFGGLPTRPATRWLVYAVTAGVLFGGVWAIFGADWTGAVARGVIFGAAMASVSIYREQRGARPRR